MPTAGTKAGTGAMLGIAIASVLAIGCGAGAGLILSQRMHSEAVMTAPSVQAVDRSLPNELGHVVAPLEGGADAGSAKVRSSASEQQNSLANKTVLLPPIMTVIANPHTTWVRLEIALMVTADDHSVEEQISQIGDDMLSYLRTIEISQIEGPSGLRFLKDDLLDRANIRTNGRVRDVVIRTLVLE